MSLLARITDFAPNTIIASQPFDDEFNQLINLLSGVSQNKSIRIISNDANFAVARFDQRSISAQDIIELFADGAEVARFEKTGKFVSLMASGAPITTVSTDVCTGLNADRVDSIEGANIAKLDTNLVKLKEIWFIRDPHDSLINQTTQHYFIAPAGTGMRITKLSLIRRSGGHAGGDVLTWRLNRNGAAVGSGVSFNDTNNAADTEYSETLNQTMSSGDKIKLDNIALPATNSELDVSIIMEWEQRLT